MAKLVEILKDESGGNFLYLDGGDQFQGGLENSKLVSSGEIMADYYNHVKMSASSIGNHEFDFDQAFLTNYLKKLNNSILSANLVDSSKTAGDSSYEPLYGQERSKIYSFSLENSPYKA